MATKIEYTEIDPRTYVNISSRYATSKVILYGDENIPTFETYKRMPFEFEGTDRYTVIPPGEEYRPDLTSYRAYGVVDLWWQIMEANSIFDIYDYKSGVNIRIPKPFNKL